MAGAEGNNRKKNNIKHRKCWRNKNHWMVGPERVEWRGWSRADKIKINAFARCNILAGAIKIAFHSSRFVRWKVSGAFVLCLLCNGEAFVVAKRCPFAWLSKPTLLAGKCSPPKPANTSSSGLWVGLRSAHDDDPGERARGAPRKTRCGAGCGWSGLRL